jgi:hypothetical protein
MAFWFPFLADQRSRKQSVIRSRRRQGKPNRAPASVSMGGAMAAAFSKLKG